MRQVLLTVAAREGEHGMSFAKRINELGYEVRCNDDSNLQKAMELVQSDRSDLKKMEKLKLNTLDTGDKPDIFDGLFKDHSIDIRTGELLGRYIAEERDSARLLRSCYEQLVAADERRRRGRRVGVAHVARGEGRRAVPRGRRAAPDRRRAGDARRTADAATAARPRRRATTSAVSAQQRRRAARRRRASARPDAVT